VEICSVTARMRRTVTLVAIAIAGSAAAPRAQDLSSAVSIEKVRAALARPASGVKFEERKPDFSIEVVWHHPFHEIFDSPPWLLPKPGWQPPNLGFSVLRAFEAMQKSVADARHERAERAAREEVQQAIADYCAAQPEKTRAQVCTTVVVNVR
jgi:hypothetical protein